MSKRIELITILADREQWGNNTGEDNERDHATFRRLIALRHPGVEIVECCDVSVMFSDGTLAEGYDAELLLPSQEDVWAEVQRNG